MSKARKKGGALRTREERGEGRFKAIAWTVVILTAIFVAIKIVPAYVNEYQLRDKMQEEARFAVVYHHSDEQIRDVVFREIQDLDLPAKREDIKIDNSSREVSITIDYHVPVDFYVYKTELHFTISTANKALV